MVVQLYQKGEEEEEWVGVAVVVGGVKEQLKSLKSVKGYHSLPWSYL